MPSVTSHEMRRNYIRDVVGQAAEQAKANAVKFMNVMERNIELEQALQALKAKMEAYESYICGGTFPGTYAMGSRKKREASGSSVSRSLARRRRSIVSSYQHAVLRPCRPGQGFLRWHDGITAALRRCVMYATLGGIGRGTDRGARGGDTRHPYLLGYEGTNHLA